MFLDAQALQTLLQLGAGITANGVLLLAWMLERQNVVRERNRSDRLEATLIRTLETQMIKDSSP